MEPAGVPRGTIGKQLDRIEPMRYNRTMTSLPFHEPRLEDAAPLRRITASCGARGSDLAWANVYLLRAKYNTRIAIDEGFLYRRYDGRTRLQGYTFPLSLEPSPDEGALRLALARVEQDAEDNGRELSFCLLTAEQKELLEKLMPGRFLYSWKESDCDYLYRRSDLAELPGTAYHAKRNHISRFLREHAEISFEELRDDNREDFAEPAHAWLATGQQTAGQPAEGLLHEQRAIACALEDYRELGLRGVLLRVDGRPAAMALAGFISPTVADIHYEKCHPDYRGAYALINREMARRLPEAELINREEDLGEPGLRQAKQSYHPCERLVKWSAYPASGAGSASPSNAASPDLGEEDASASGGDTTDA